MTRPSRYKPDTIWHRVVNWMALKGFGQSTAGSVTMATPFVGYLILYHDAVRPYLGGLGGLLATDTGACGRWIGFQTHLNLLYFGLLALGIGTIIYRICADREIKTHAGVSDYVERNAPHITVRNLRSMWRIIHDRRPGMATDLVWRGSWLDPEEVGSLADAIAQAENAAPENPTLELKHDVMRSYFKVLDRYSARHWAWVASLLYLIGFSLLAIPGLLFTARVLCTIVV